MIKLQVIGNLGKDCVTNAVNGKNVINFNVAHTEKFRDAQGVTKEKTIWVDCAYWTDRTAIAPYLRKGQQVFVEGSPEVRTYAKNDGTTGASLTLRVQSVQLLGGRPEGAGGAPAANYNNNYNAAPAMATANAGSAANAAVPEPFDDLPF